MGAIMVYIIKVSLLSVVFLIFNNLIFSRDTFHKFNRITLLLIIPFSLILPLIDLNSLQSLFRTAEGHAEGGSLTISGIASGGEVSLLPVVVLWIMRVYLFCALFFAVKYLYAYLKLFFFILPKKSDLCSAKGLSAKEEGYLELLEGCKKRVGYSGRIHLVRHRGESAPFSWMNYIVISESDLEEDGREILIHEISHIKGRDSWDLILIDLFIIFQWFNPASWLLKHSLQQVHEYKADESVINSGIDAKQYQLLLIKKAVGQRLYSMANSFNHSKLKNRITMMLKEKSNKWGYAKFAYALPLAFLALSAFATPKVSAKFNEISSAKVTQISENSAIFEEKSAIEVPTPKEEAIVEVAVPQEKDEPIPFAIVEEKPTFNGGDANSFSTWVNEQLVYPAEAFKKNVQGRVTLQFTVNSDGAVSNVKVLRGVSKELDAEAVRVVKLSPKWTPGKQKGKPVSVIYNFPIIFMLK